MEDICDKGVLQLLHKKRSWSRLFVPSVTRKGEGRYLPKGGFTNAVMEILCCYKEWKIESVGHKEDT